MSTFADEPFFRISSAEQRSEELFALNQTFRSQRFTESGVSATLGTETTHLFDADLASVLDRYRLDHQTPLHVLIRLFLFNNPEERRVVEGVLDSEQIALLRRFRLLQLGDDGVYRALVGLFPVGRWICAADHAYEVQPEYLLQPNRVMPPVRATYNLIGLAAKCSGSNALDLGTGSGVTALTSCDRFERVIAVDLNPRATNFARFNAIFNGVANVEVRDGDLYDPVRGETFDLITSTPPFVPTPSTPCVLFRDGGPTGENMLRALVEGASRHLSDDGIGIFASALVEQEHIELDDKLTSWLGEGDGVTAIALRGPSVHPYEFILSQLIAGSSDPDSPSPTETWIEHYRSQRICGVMPGVVLVRRKGREPNTGWVLPLPEPLELHPKSWGQPRALFDRLTEWAPIARANRRIRLRRRPISAQLDPTECWVRGIHLPFDLSARFVDAGDSGLFADDACEVGFWTDEDGESAPPEEVEALIRFLYTMGFLELAD